MADPITAAVADLVLKKSVTKGYSVTKYVIDFESNSKELQNTMNSIKAALLDGESMSEQRIDPGIRNELSVLLDRWDDYTDDRASKELAKQVSGGSSLATGIRSFFSPSNQLVTRIKDAKKVHDMNKKLRSIVMNHDMIARIRGTPTQASSIQTMGSPSDFPINLFVGRAKDRDHILSMLSEDSQSSGTLSVASIVAIGGMGKTALAWSVYNDDKMNSCFDVKFWVSLTQDFDVRKVLQEIISYGAREIPLNQCNDEQLYHHFQRAICGKKFLLVLDNVWDNPNLRNNWLQLRTLLEFGANGSMVFSTTRDQNVAKHMDSNTPYKLGYLTEDDSWLLFQKVAFPHHWPKEPGVEAIGVDIAKMCHKMPLVIKSIAGHLARKSTLQEWCAFKEDQRANFASYGDDVMHTLKFSYDQLDASHKLCVNYCSLFEKGGAFSIDEMIHRWIALDYVKPTRNESLEVAGENCMTNLLNCGFLQSKPFYSDRGLGMHDVMYELVQTVAGFKYKVIDSNTVEIDERVRHLSFWKAVTSSASNEDLNRDYWEIPSSLFKIKHLQSLVRGSGLRRNNRLEVRNLSMCGKLISRFESLRLLDLDGVGIKELPTSVGDLICLRFLNLSKTEIIKLPNSIARLVNLETLYLVCCKNLEQLPKDMSKLVSLRHLLLEGSQKLRHMPMGLWNLKKLITLDTFIVGEQIESKAGSLADLVQLNNLSGSLDIKVRRESKHVTLPESGATILKMKKNLRVLRIKFKNGTTVDERVLECLQPPRNLETLNIRGYGGEKLPSWMMDCLHNHVPFLSKIILKDCKSCRYLCSFGRLLHLKDLDLRGLDELEYVEDIADNVNNDDELSQVPLFPSLTELYVEGVPKLKGWWGMPSNEQEVLQVQVQYQDIINWKPAFPTLRVLYVDSVELAITIARQQIGGFPSLEKLYIKGIKFR